MALNCEFVKVPAAKTGRAPRCVVITFGNGQNANRRVCVVITFGNGPNATRWVCVVITCGNCLNAKHCRRGIWLHMANCPKTGAGIKINTLSGSIDSLAAPM